MVGIYRIDCQRRPNRLLNPAAFFKSAAGQTDCCKFPSLLNILVGDNAPDSAAALILAQRATSSSKVMVTFFITQ